LETRLSFETLKPIIGTVAYLEPKLWLKKQKLGTNVNPTKDNFAILPKTYNLTAD